jgi:hypothetical protein
MASGVDALLDERSGKALDHLQRYATANQRSYFRIDDEQCEQRQLEAATDRILRNEAKRWPQPRRQEVA